MRILNYFTPLLAMLHLLVVVALHVWPAAASAALSTSVLLQALCAAVGLREDASLMKGSRNMQCELEQEVLEACRANEA